MAVMQSFCCVCTRQCPIGVTVENGEITQVGPSPHPDMPGTPCVKGLALPEYVCHGERVLTPLRRTGPRGSGRFEPISWDGALSEIAERLNKLRAEFGADSVAFFSGYSKWYRAFLRRFAYSFGTLNYGTESSSCFRATTLAALLNSGFATMPDTENAGSVTIWSCSQGIPPAIRAQRGRGLKIIVVEPNSYPFIKNNCDLHLKILPGTDGALAWGFAKAFIDRGFLDRDFIRDNCLGWADYAAYAKGFDAARVCSVCGIKRREFERAVKLITDNPPMAQQIGNAGMIHHTNGVQNFRAIDALSAITGSFDRRGGNLPTPVDISRDIHHLPGCDMDLFWSSVRPETSRRIGGDTYPVWNELIDEFQAMDLPRHAEQQKPYPLKAVFALGLNARMFPDDSRFFAMLEKLDYFVDADLFLTDTAKYADIVLPVCSSLERAQAVEVRGKIYYSRPVIAPRGESISDEELLCRLSPLVNPQDELMCAGVDACYDAMTAPLGFTAEELKSSPDPMGRPAGRPAPGESTAGGFKTPSGKFELASTVLKKHGCASPLPEYRSSLDCEDGRLPLILVSGVRYPHVLHSRLHRIESLRSLRREPAADMHPLDAKALGLADGAEVRLKTRVGSIPVTLRLSASVRRGTVNMYHGYSEADVNSIIPADCNDPCSGFPNYRTVRCAVEAAV